MADFRCITEDHLRRTQKHYSYITPGHDDTRILSFDEYAQRYPIHPMYGQYGYFNVCASQVSTYYNHYTNEDFAGGRVLAIYDNNSGTGWLATVANIGLYQWSSTGAVVAGADSLSDSYYDTYKIMQRYFQAGAPAAYAAYNSNLSGCAWVLPSPNHALYMASLWNTYGGWPGVQNIWSSAEGVPTNTTAIAVDFPTQTTAQVNKTLYKSTIGFRIYDEGPVVMNTSGSIYVDYGPVVGVQFVCRMVSSAYDVNSYPYDDRTRANEPYNITVQYTDPNDLNSVLTYSTTLNPYEKSFIVTASYPKHDGPAGSVYWVECRVYTDADWGVVNGTISMVGIPSING